MSRHDDVHREKGRHTEMATPVKSPGDEELRRASTPDHLVGGGVKPTRLFADMGDTPSQEDPTDPRASAAIEHMLLADFLEPTSESPPSASTSKARRHSSPLPHTESAVATLPARRASAPPGDSGVALHVYRYIESYLDGMLTDQDIQLIRLLQFICDARDVTDLKDLLSLQAYHQILFLKRLHITPCFEVVNIWKDTLNTTEQLPGINHVVEREIAELIVADIPDKLTDRSHYTELKKRAEQHVRNHLAARLLLDICQRLDRGKIRRDKARAIARHLAGSYQLDGLLPAEAINKLSLTKIHCEESTQAFIDQPDRRDTSLKGAVINQLAFSPLMRSDTVLSHAIGMAGFFNTQLSTRACSRSATICAQRLAEHIDGFTVSPDDLIPNGDIAERLRAAHLAVIHAIDSQNNHAPNEPTMARHPVNDTDICSYTRFSRLAEKAIQQFIRESDTLLQSTSTTLLQAAADPVTPDESDTLLEAAADPVTPDESDTLLEAAAGPVTPDTCGVLRSDNPAEAFPAVTRLFDTINERMISLGTRLFGANLFSPPAAEGPSDEEIIQRLVDIFRNALEAISHFMPDIVATPKIVTHLREAHDTPNRASKRGSSLYGSFIDTYYAHIDEGIGLKHPALGLTTGWATGMLSRYLAGAMRGFLVDSFPAGHQIAGKDDLAYRPYPEILGLWGVLTTTLFAATADSLCLQLTPKRRPPLTSHRALAFVEAMASRFDPITTGPDTSGGGAGPEAFITPRRTARSLTPAQAAASPQPLLVLDRYATTKRDTLTQQRTAWVVGITAGFVLGGVVGVALLIYYLTELARWRGRVETCRTLQAVSPGATRTAKHLRHSFSQMRTPWRRCESILAQQAPQAPAAVEICAV